MRQPTARLRIGTNLAPGSPSWPCGRNLWPRAPARHPLAPHRICPIEPHSKSGSGGSRNERPPARAAQERPPGVGTAVRRLEDRYRELQAPAGRATSRCRGRSLAGVRRDDHPQLAPRAARRGRPAPPHPRTPIRGPGSPDGFQLASEDDEFDLRFTFLDQTDFKLFIANDRVRQELVCTSPGCGSTSKAD